MQIHHNRCHLVGLRCKYLCFCPLRCSYNTVDSFIGKLRFIFHTIGRDGEWDKRLGEGNPAADTSVEDYLCVVTAEQLRSRTTPKQATTFFVDKLTQLPLFLERRLVQPVTPLQSLIIARDQAYFKTVFFSGDRPGAMLK